MRLWIELEINDFEDYKRIGTQAARQVRAILRTMQQNKCAYCGEFLDDQYEWQSGMDLSVDHDHKTGMINGLVHTGCNTKKARLGQG